MRLTDIFNMFTKSDKENFPINDCIVLKRNAIKEGNRYYYCLVVNLSIPDSFEIKSLKPFVWTDKDGSVYYGWKDRYNNEYDNLCGGIKLLNTAVIGFKANDSFPNEFGELNNILKELLESQYT